MNNFIVYDLETGGFDLKSHGIVEIALVAIDHISLEVVDEYCKIIQPYNMASGKLAEYTSGAQDIHGVSVERMRSEGLPAETVVRDIIAFFTKHKIKSKKPIIAGHNIHKFDNPRLEAFLATFGQKLSQLTDVEDSIDTLKWAKFKWQKPTEVANHKLSTCCEALNIELVDAHSALPDTKANSKLLTSFIKSMRGDGGLVEQKRSRDEFKFQIA